MKAHKRARERPRWARFLRANLAALALGTVATGTLLAINGDSAFALPPVGVTTAATPATPVDHPISDTAALEPGTSSPLTADVTFSAYGPTDPNCTSLPVFTSTVPVNQASLSAQSALFTPTAAGHYHWIAEYPGDANNGAGTSACGDSNETSNVFAAQPNVTTVSTLNGVVTSDTATLTSAFNPTGTVQFSLFFNDNSCGEGGGLPVFTDTVPLSGVSATSGSYAATQTGTYYWLAAYSGDANNDFSTSECMDNGEDQSITVGPTTPTTIGISSVTDVNLGSSIDDTATLSAASSVVPSGMITFSAFAPSDTTCAATPVFTSVVPVTAFGSYTSANFTPANAGTYNWVASYSGDPNFAPSTSRTPTACDAGPSTVFQSTPTITSQSTLYGVVTADTATVTGPFNPTGSVTFTLWFDDSSCGGGEVSPSPLFTSTVPLFGTIAASGPFTATAIGTYYWLATYNGDINNASVSTVCGDPAETQAITVPVSALVPVTPPNTVVGASVTDTVQLETTDPPTGSITFKLYGPNDPACATAIFSSTLPVSGDGNFTSRPPFQVLRTGTYDWVVSYSGDGVNPPAATMCGEADQVFMVAPAPDLLTAASTVLIGGTVLDTATLSPPSATAVPPSPTGTMSFALFAASDPNCLNVPIFATTVGVNGFGSYPDLAPFTVPVNGTYRWDVVYSGDANNARVALTCVDPTTVVLPGPTPPPSSVPPQNPGPTTSTTLGTNAFIPTTTTTTVPRTTTTTPAPTTTTTLPPTTTTTVAPITTAPPTTPPPTTAPPTTKPTSPTTPPPTTSPTTPPTTPTGTTSTSLGGVTPPGSTPPGSTPPSSSSPGSTPPSSSPSSSTPPSSTPPTSTPTSTPPTTPTNATLTVLDFSNQPSSPAGAGVNAHVSGLPASCKTVYFFFGGTRIGSATVRDGSAAEGSISVPGDASIGAHTISVSCESSGKLAVATTSYRIEPSSVHRTEFLTSLNQPREIDLTAKSFGLSALLAILLFILLAFPSQIFNATLIEHYEEVRGWFGLHRPVSEVVGDVNQRILFPLFVVGGGVLFALLTPDFGFNLSTLALVLGLGIAVLVTTIGLAVPTFLFFGVKRHERGQVLVLPGTLVIGAAFVLISRLIDFQPGYLYGVLAIFLFRSELDRKREGVLAAASALLVMGAAFLLWWARVPLAGSTMAHPNFGSVLLESAIGGAFVMGVESTVVAMLPMRFLDGERIKAWSRVVWLVLFLLALTTVIQVLIQPGTGYVGHTSTAAKISVLALYLVFAAFSFAFWAYFRFRESPEEKAEPDEDEFEREGDLDVR